MTEDERRARMEKALEWGGPTHTLGDVADLVGAGRAQWWSKGDGMIVSELHRYPLLKAAHYWLIAGDLRDCLALDAEICAWARDEGCTIATATGRRGWGRVAERLGWQPFHPTFWKPLVDGVHYGGRP